MQPFELLSRWRQWARLRVRVPAKRGGGPFGGAFQLRHLDAGSCNACELELVALSGPHYDSARAGIEFVASPRHADALVLTGPVTRNLAEAVKMTLEATPEKRVVIACGDCACGAGPFAGSYAVLPRSEDVVHVDARITGCPPSPQRLLEGIAEARELLR